MAYAPWTLWEKNQMLDKSNWNIFFDLWKKDLYRQCLRWQIHIKPRRTTKQMTRIKLSSAHNMWYNLWVYLCWNVCLWFFPVCVFIFFLNISSKLNDWVSCPASYTDVQGTSYFLLKIPWTKLVLDTGQIDWAGWKPAWLLVVASRCSTAMVAASGRESTGRRKLQPHFWICSFSTLFFPCPYSSLCACSEEEDGSVELMLMPASGPKHQNFFHCWILWPTFPVFLCKWGTCNDSIQGRIFPAEKDMYALLCAGVSTSKN